MNWNDAENEDTLTYRVVVNHEEQYSILPEYKDNPAGWRDAGKAGPKSDCLAYIKDVWTDMRPLSLRKKMEEFAAVLPPNSPPSDSNTSREPGLVDRLCEGAHAVEVKLRPEKTLNLFKAAIDRNYVHIRFTQTRGGTELGFRLDRDNSDFSNADFDKGTGTAHLEGSLTLDYVKVRCIADVDLTTLTGSGHLLKVDAAYA